MRLVRCGRPADDRSDLNLPMYAVDSGFPQHAVAKRWWQGCLNGDEPIGLCEVVSFGFLRLTTRRGIFAQPLRAHA
jgi:predicted nucleic acid-binding protein